MNTKAKKKNKGFKASENYKMLKTSWSVQAKTFFKNSTLHGVRYIAETDRPALERFCWFGCVNIGAVATIIIILSLWDKFQTNPTITGLDTDFHNWDVPFPAITVCQQIPSNASNIEEYLNKRYYTDNDVLNLEDTINFYQKFTQLSYANIREFVKMKEIADNIIPKEQKLKELAFQLMNKCEDVFDECIFKSHKYNCCEGFFPVFTESGFCYTFNSRHYEKNIPRSDSVLPEFTIQYIQETDIKWSLKFGVKSTEAPMPIYILDSNEMAGLDVQPQHIWDFKVSRISFSVKATYTTEDTKQLSMKQRHCAFPDEIKLKIDNIYTYATCTRQCRMDTAMDKCSCVPHFYPEENGYRHCKIGELKCIANYLEEITDVDRCGCLLGCSNTVYEAEKLNEVGNEEESTFLETEFVSWPMVRYKREVLFGWVDLLVAFGGIAGLFLGFSLLSAVEIIYYFTIRACCMVYRQPKELKKIQLEESLKPEPEYDLSLTPYWLQQPLPGNGINEILKYCDDYQDLQTNKIYVRAQQRKIVPLEDVIPPFGIEFLN